MRTLINSSTININLNSSSSSASFDTPSSRSPAPALTSHTGRPAAPSNRSLSASAASANHNAKHPPSKPPRPPIAPTLQARARFSSAPVTASDSRSPPLGFHDHKQQQHVLALTTTTTRSSSSSAASSANKMPPGDSRPRPPPLSAAAAKTIGRTPLTPKIAAKGPSMAPPLTRRSTQNRDDAFLASVTPRSGSRQNRAESTNTTPNGTPNLERGQDGWDPRASLTIDSGRQSLSPGDPLGDSADSKFFYASEARPAQQPPSRPPSRPSTAASKSATFFYANGATAEPKRAISPPVKTAFVPLLATPPEPAASKFFYASGTPEVSSKSSLQSSGPPSSGSSSSRAMNGRPSTSSSATAPGHSMPQRPMSPIKMLQQNPPPTIKNTTTPGLNSRPQITSPPPLTPSMTTNPRRRVSTESTPRSTRGHARTKSLMSLDSPKVSMSPPQQPSSPSSPPASPSAHVVMTQPAMTMASILQAVEDFGEEPEDITPEEVQSPTKSPQPLDPVREVVANARRERKVQDLEITNASLEAINRTLERQLRKQTAEIRRFKRLSRLSLASAASSRVPSEALPSLPISLSDLSEEEESAASEEDEPDSLEDSDLSSAESASAADPLSPLADEKLVVRRKRDERRLHLDLTKHQELLVDSQKINQSLKRCLSWTEVLIKEGQKALEYTVRVSDVDFGGHVLAPADEDETSHLDEQLLKTLDIELEDGLEPPLPWEKSSQDRDSGIELQADGV
ncbi:hypothetical protein AK830_g629 [Neonectria ditissima]|uniref:Uncharacterized protein n=1 Tax=Neonectria ditissima TaxID=78410 RepID=A0A0P7B735_9HYPO|nr:hypothetical protein AK830_g629 [Neonectria ditissima]